jgi:DNA-binding NarL/FixJ family response regulator
MVSNLTKKPDIIVVDDNLNFRQGLIFLITIDNVASVIGKASNGKEFIELLANLKPDLVLIDINMLQMNGMEATQTALKMIPNLKIIAFTMFGDEEYYYTMNSLGVKGFLLKSSGINEIEKAIQKVINGENYLSDELLKKIIINFARRNADKPNVNTELTAKETEVMRYVCQGLTSEEIALKMSVSQITVKGYKMNILEKYNRQINSPKPPIHSDQDDKND